MPSLRSLLRHAWADLATALAFLLLATVFLDRLPDRGTRWLFVPIVLALFVHVAMFVMRLVEPIRHPALRCFALALVAAAYGLSVWLLGHASWHFERALWPALWLFAAQFAPNGMPFLSRAHLAPVLELASYGAATWGFAFMVFALLVVFGPQNVEVIDGVTHSTVPRWVYVAVWTSYFIALAVLRASFAERHAVQPRDAMRA